MGALSVQQLRGHIRQVRERRRWKRQQRRQLFNNIGLRNNVHNKIRVITERVPRSKIKTNERQTEKSIGGRYVKVKNISETDTINTIKISEEWLHPFENNPKREPVIKINIDNVPQSVTVDTGCTRLMMTSALATNLWGNLKNKLSVYPNREVTDAQNNPVQVLGYKLCDIKIGNHLNTKYPIVIYEAQHKECLMGYAFLVDYGIDVFSGRGIGKINMPDVVRRLNVVTEPMECTALDTKVIPAKAMTTLPVKVWFPSSYDETSRQRAVGCPIVIHSEDLETVGPTQIKCPYTYDILSVDNMAHVVIDNSENAEPLCIKKNEIIAHAEFVIENVQSETINRIIKDSSYGRCFDEETQPGEYKYETEEKPPRFEYLDKINIKSEEPGTKEFVKDLLINTEPFWSKTSWDIGKFDRPAKITLTDTTPVYERYRPINPKMEAQANEIIEQLEKHKIISKANSPFCSQAVWVYKKHVDRGGKDAIAGEADVTVPRKLRLAIDYRKINKKIFSQCHFPNPDIKSIIMKLKKAKYVSIVDLTWSYWQVPLTEETKPILGFQAQNAQFVWERLPMGITPSMAMLSESVADTICNGGIADCTTCYVDNILVSSDSLQSHKRDLKRMIETFQKRGWKANPQKSHLFINTECRLFGFHINLRDQSVGPDPQKIQNIMDLPIPQTHKQLRSLCGMFNYYSDLVSDMGPLMAPLHEATKEGIFKWTQQCTDNFEKLKKKLKAMPVIYMPDFNKPMHVFSDAAMGQFLGYHVSQWHEKFKKYVPICYGSHKFSPSERTMSQPEAELYAIIYALTQESLLLSFSKIICHTDCKSLTYLFRFSRINSKLMRWQLILSSYDIDIYFEKSDSIGIILSDMLSRRPGDRMINRRPKQAEIENLPKMDFTNKPSMTLQQAQKEIEKELSSLPPVAPDTIKMLHIKELPEVMDISQLPGNAQILEQFEKTNQGTGLSEYQIRHVHQPDHWSLANNMLPHSRLIHSVLQEAPDISLQKLKHYQLEDPFFGQIIKAIVKDNCPKDGFVIKEGILLKQVTDPITDIDLRICVPKALSRDLIHRFHSSVFGAHADLKKLMTNLKKRFFIKNLSQECQTVIKQCSICTLNKTWNVPKQPFGQKIKVTGPREIWAMDICSVDMQAQAGLPSSFLIIVDVWSLFTVAVPIKANPTAREILEKFSRHIIQVYGIPKIGFLTDGAKNFSNTLSNQFAAILGLQKFRIAPFNAKANPAERVNRAILSGLRYALQQFQLQAEVFKNLLNFIVLSWNTSVLSHLGFSPYRLFLSTDYDPAALTGFVTLHEAERDYGDFITALVQTQTLVENLVNTRYQETRDKRYQKQHSKARIRVFQPGSLVMVRQMEDNTQRVHKLRARFKGPYKVMREHENTVEVLLWTQQRQIQLFHKYKGEARGIPKFELELISKDRCKPCDKLAFYFDDDLARRFYQEFWDAVRDVQPINEVTRLGPPGQFVDKNPPHRPSSLILPVQLGIQMNNPYCYKTQGDYGGLQKKTRSSIDSDSSSIDSPQGSQISDQHIIETEEVRSRQSDSDTASQNNTDSDQNSSNNDDNDELPKGAKAKSGHGVKPFVRHYDPQNPYQKINVHLAKPKEKWVTTATGVGFEGSPKLLMFDNNTRQQHDYKLRSGSNQGSQSQKGHSTKSSKSTKSAKTNKTISAHHKSEGAAAVEKDFSRLEEYYEHPEHFNLEQDMQSVADSINQSYEEVYKTIEEILSPDED